MGTCCWGLARWARTAAPRGADATEAQALLSEILRPGPVSPPCLPSCLPFLWWPKLDTQTLASARPPGAETTQGQALQPSSVQNPARSCSPPHYTSCRSCKLEPPKLPDTSDPSNSEASTISLFLAD